MVYNGKHEKRLEKLIQGLLILTLTSGLEGPSSVDDIDYLAEISSLIRDSDMHLSTTEAGGLGSDEHKTSRRLSWCCYVQDRMARLFLASQPLTIESTGNEAESRRLRVLPSIPCSQRSQYRDSS